MTLEKKSLTASNLSCEALHVPSDSNWGMYNTSRIKTASIDKMKPVDIGGFDLQAAINNNPEHLFVKIFAIKKDEVNDNGDAFSEDELKKGAHTFIGVPVFVNHQNDDVEKARGKVLHAWYDDTAGGIYIIATVDRVAYPRLARGIEEKYTLSTSMGTSVSYSICSICHNKASVASEFCTCIKERKTRKFSGRKKCSYHKSPDEPKDPCPICGTKKGESQENTFKEAQIFEWNYGLKFIENSFVVNPACHDCGVCDILNIPNVEVKIAQIKETLEKLSQADNEGLIKTAGQNEIKDLNEAMQKLERVARSMMAQKKQVSLEYVSDIVESLADIQKIANELSEMGYGSLPSPPEAAILYGNETGSEGIGAENAQFADPMAQSQPQPQQPQQPNIGQPSSGPLGGGEIGTVTRPTFSSITDENEKELIKESLNIKDTINKLGSELNQMLLIAKQRRTAMSDSVVRETPSKESQVNMSNSKKVEAAGSGVQPSQTEVITEKQIDDAKLPLHPRQGESYEAITESSEQLGGKVRVNDTTTENGQVRHDKPYEFITEAQLASVKDGYMVRWNEFPEVITEAQWDDMSRAIGADVPEDYIEQITQAQLISLRDSHSWSDPEVITEGQLGEQKKVYPGGKGETARWKGASVDPKSLVKAALGSVSDAIANYGLSPSDVSKAFSTIISNPQSQMKAAYITLVNAAPWKKEARADERNRFSYHGKIASSAFKPVDAVLASLADNIGYLKAENLIDTVRFILSDKKAFAKAENEAQLKITMASAEKNAPVADPVQALRDALADLDRSEDGMYKIQGSISGDLGKIDINNKSQFIDAVAKFAQSQVEIPTVLLSVDVGPDANNPEVFEAVVKDASMLTPQEKEAASKFEQTKTASKENKPEEKRAEARSEIVKQAQMMGGQVPTGMAAGGAPGGATLPAAPGDPAAAAGQPPVESFGQEPGAGMDDEAGGMDGDISAKPPGSICPVCGSEDCDVISGKSKCNNCGSEWLIKVNLEVIRWSGLTDDEEGGIPGDEGAGEGFELPEGEGAEVPDMAGAAGGAGAPGMADQSIPVAAMTILNPLALKKIAESKIVLGRVSPLTGSTNTIQTDKNEFFCLDSGTRYIVSFAHDKTANKVFAEWRWIPKLPGNDCPSCKRAKKTFVNALSKMGISEEKFDTMSTADKGRIILSMNENGLLKQIKTANKNGNVLDDYKKAYTVGDKFPIESCREKLARRFGENALAMSGPCEGNNLADCVCNQLKSAGIYSDKVAIKVADAWGDCDGTIECVEDHIRSGFNIKQSALICEQVKTKYANSSYQLADQLGGQGMGSSGMGSSGMGGAAQNQQGSMGGCSTGMGGSEPADDAGLLDSVDPFAGDMDNSMGDMPGSEGDVSSAPGADGALPSGDVGGPMDANPVDAGIPGGHETVPVELDVSVLTNLVNSVKDALDQISGNVGGDLGGMLGGGMPGGMPGGDMASGVEVELGMPGGEGETSLPEGVEGHENPGESSGDGGMIPPSPTMPSAQSQGMGHALEMKTHIDGHEEEIPVPGASAQGDSEDTSSNNHDESNEEISFKADDAEEKHDEDHGHDENSEHKKKENPLDRFTKDDDHHDGDHEEGHEEEMKEHDRFANVFKKGRIAATGKSNLDLSKVMEHLQKKADKVNFNPAQDTSGIGDFSKPSSSAIGHENAFKADKPDVPSGTATIGKEDADLQKLDDPEIPVGGKGANMGDEAAQGYTSEKQNDATGGKDGQGTSKAAGNQNKNVSTKQMKNRLFDSLVKAAEEKKVEGPKPIEDLKDIGQTSDNTDLSTTPEGSKRKGREGDDGFKGPEGGNKAFIGHEEEAIGDIPKAEKNAPSVPVGGGRNEKYDKNEKNAPENETKTKGTVIAQGDAESSKVRRDAAFKLGGIMLERQMISASQLAEEVDKLMKYDTSHIQMLEKTLTAASATKKGLDTAPNGVEKPMIVPETSNFKNASDELTKKLVGMFTLTKKLDAAKDDPNIEASRLYRN